MRLRSQVAALAVVLLGCGEGPAPAATSKTCADKCAAEAAFDCADEMACRDTCERTLAAEGACSGELSAYAACYGAQRAALSGCYTPDPCVAAFGDYLTCADAECTTTSCDHPNGTCTCEGTCGTRAVRSVCTGADCACFVGGAEVGKCSDGSMPICGLKESCCTGVYFLAK